MSHVDSRNCGHLEPLGDCHNRCVNGTQGQIRVLLHEIRHPSEVAIGKMDEHQRPIRCSYRTEKGRFYFAARVPIE